MTKKPDLSKLSVAEREELSRLIAENEALNKENQFLKGEQVKKDENIKSLNATISELTKILIKEKEIVKKYNLERYFSKADRPTRKTTSEIKRANGLPSTVKADKKTPGRKVGSKNFGDDFLETLSLENAPLTLDIAQDLLNDNPNVALHKVTEETSYLVKRVKAHVLVYKVIMPVYKDEQGTFHKAELPTPIFHSSIDASLLSDAITMKYFLGVPEYRYAKWLKNEGLPFSQKTINNWALQSASVLEPFYHYLKGLFTHPDLDVANIHIDETWLDVIENKATGRDKNYVFCYSAVTKLGKLPFFEYSSTRQIDAVKKILHDYHATVTVDGYAGYNTLRTNGITIQRCMVHARREFANIVKTLSDAQFKDSAAYNVVNYMDKIFHEEKKMRDAKLTHAQIKENRQSEAYQTLINDLESYIDGLHPEKGSSLDKATTYYKKMNGEQWTYVNDGRLTLDNNEAERQAKKFVIDRKNFLFSKSEKGAIASCILLTMIDLAYVNDVEPRAYLELVLNHITKQPPENLLPWSTFTKETLKTINP